MALLPRCSNIGTQQTSDTILETIDNSTIYKRTTFLFSIDKFFKKGDKFRVEVEVTSTLSVDASCGFYFDGANKDFGQVDPVGVSVGSNLIVQIPLELDL